MQTKGIFLIGHLAAVGSEKQENTTNPNQPTGRVSDNTPTELKKQSPKLGKSWVILYKSMTYINSEGSNGVDRN